MAPHASGFSSYRPESKSNGSHFDIDARPICHYHPTLLSGHFQIAASLLKPRKLESCLFATDDIWRHIDMDRLLLLSNLSFHIRMACDTWFELSRHLQRSHLFRYLALHPRQEKALDVIFRENESLLHQQPMLYCVLQDLNLAISVLEASVIEELVDQS